MAQLGARLNGIQKVRGSNPLISIKKSRSKERLFFMFQGAFTQGHFFYQAHVSSR